MSTCNLVAESVWKDIGSNRTGLSHFIHNNNANIVFEYPYSSSCIEFSFVGLTNLATLMENIGSSDRRSVGSNFEKATRIVDLRGVRKISGEPSGRSIFQVVGESRRKEEYLCYAEHYCACYSFLYDVVNRGEQLCCKHQLAAILADLIGACDVKVSDEELAMLLSKV